MKYTKSFVAILIAFIGFGSFAQTADKVKQTPTEVERGKELKKWFDGGDIIIDAYVEKDTWVEVNANTGYMCARVKVIRVLKGGLDTGYINIKTNDSKQSKVRVSDEGESDWRIQITGRYLIKIKKTEFTKEGFEANNKGVYAATRDFVYNDVKSKNGIFFRANRKAYTFNDEADLNQALQEYCGVKNVTKTTTQKAAEKKALTSLNDK